MRGSRGGKNPRVSSSLGQGDVVVKRMTLPGVLLSANSSGNVPLTTYSASLVESSPATEWASFAARYQQYRVRAFRLILEPAYPAANEFSIGTNVHTALYVSDYIGTAAPASVAGVLADERSRVFCTNQRVDFRMTWARNPNARLWNPTTAALPGANAVGIALASAATGVLGNANPMYTATLEWDVEFRGAQ